MTQEFNMNERRNSERRLVNLNVILYHDAHGDIPGKICDVSSGGMNIDIFNRAVLNKRLSNEELLVSPKNMDVLFKMECLRVEQNCIGLKFLE